MIEPLSEAEIVELRRTRDLYQIFHEQLIYDAAPVGCGAVQVPDDGGESGEPHTHSDWALHYGALGIKVFPCNPKNKIPLVPCDKDEKGKKIPGTGWKKKASCEPEIIRAWWRKYPRAMIGAACGEASGFWAIDPDVPKLKDGVWSSDGVASWSALLSEHGPHGPTIEVTTASGGRHIYFKYDPAHPIGNTEGELTKLGINVRGDGGLVILPHSQRSDGKEYISNKPFDHAALASAPEWLYAAIGNRQAAKEKVNIEFGDDVPRVDVASLNLRKIKMNGSAVRKLIVQGPVAGDNFNGDRSKALFFVLCQLALAEVPPDKMLGIILDPNNRISDHCYPNKDGSPKESPDGVAKRQIERAIAYTADEVGLEARIKEMQAPGVSRDFLDALLSEATARPHNEGVPPNVDGHLTNDADPPPHANGEDTSANGEGPKADEPYKSLNTCH